MLKFLRRKNIMKICLWFLVVFVIVTFVFSFGPGRLLRKNQGRPTYAGKIFGRKVSTESYIESYQACYHQALMTYGQELRKIIDFLNLKEQAWNRLILIQEADREKIKVGDEEVREYIMKLPIFEEDEKFDEKRYDFILGYYLKTTPRNFEEETRQNLRISKVVEEITKDITLSDEELEKMYKKEHEKVKAAYFLIEPKDFKDKVKPGQDQIQSYYTDHKESFKIPPKVNVVYLPITIDLTKDDVEVKEEEIVSFYEENMESYKKPPQEQGQEQEEETEYKPFDEVRGEVVDTLLNLKSKDKALDIAVEVHQKIKDTGNFKEIAEEYSISPKETGLFSSAESIPQIGWSYNFVVTAFNLKDNEVSEVIELPDGYYILKLKDKKDSYIPEFNEIKEKVKEAYINEEALSLAKDKAKEGQKLINDKIKEGISFKEAAELLSAQVQTTEFFTMYDYVPGIGKSEEFIQSAFSLKENEVSNPIRVPQGYCLLVQEELKPIDKEEFEKNKEEFEKKARQIKEAEIFEKWFEELRKEADVRSEI